MSAAPQIHEPQTEAAQEPRRATISRPLALLAAFCTIASLIGLIGLWTLSIQGEDATQGMEALCRHQERVFRDYGAGVYDACMRQRGMEP